jgi:hypothetical protein
MSTRTIASALDAVAFGPAKTLDLHAFRSVDDAVRHTERWLRERQVSRAGSVLVITGRGARSPGGVPVMRPAIQKLFTRLRRLGVVARVQDHTEGSFTVMLAPVTALFEAPVRARSRAAPSTAPTEARDFGGLSEATRASLRLLAERMLEALGVRVTPALIADEMHRQLSLLAPGLPAGEDPDRALQRIAREAVESMEEE